MTEEKKETFLYDTSNEQVVIAAALADDAIRKRLVRQLSPSEFLAPEHSTIWRALITLTNKALACEEKTLTGFLKNEGLPDRSFSYVSALFEEAETPENLDYHVDMMGWDATRARVLKDPLPGLIETLRDPKAPPTESISSARSITRALEMKGGRRHVVRPREHHRGYVSELKARREKRNVFPLGAEEFDNRLTEGFMPGKTAVLAGLPGAGKSTIALAWCVLLAKAGRKVTYCAWEMSPESATDVLCSHLTRIPLRDIVQGTIDDEQFKRIVGATTWIAKHIRFVKNPFFDELRTSKKKPSNERNLDILEGTIAESGSDAWVYDLWERCLFWTKPDDVTRALVRMQEMHKEYNIHGTLLHQLNLKDVEKRSDRRPTRDAIKGTGAYVEIADLIFGVHREAQFKQVMDRSVETICLKQRKGATNWSVRWDWDGATCQVSNPVEVPFDPGLESAGELGDVGSIEGISSGKKRRRRGRDG